ncbi:TetR/AcrR family transcriptional regulator [Pseudomonas sp. KSR10]|jgi:AcrR family transcriptional regulator|uniref:TetR/AcrR family transcriptional regulator n=1 Tax=unclassified Pseudomonas TaxID=196821 RepID=UPI001EF81313|nr:TetR/AcrR family transcriptional regulator [Pseudomonas sp. KSR10]MCG6538745.1 TetR/AcrR family transcriptional regulator [Pseudomonas sp. KSR10]
MDKREEMIAGAARMFDSEGFRGIGIDRALAPSGASTRTLYKHFGSRDGLVIAVLEARHHAFMTQLEAQSADVNPVESLFDTLRQWIEEHGARGCMLLRARSEYAEASGAIVSLVLQQKGEFRNEVEKRVQSALGYESPALSTQVWLLFEGATAAASVTSVSVIDDAKAAALSLLEHARVEHS